MSPSDAPESDEPYCATASFSSLISRALMESEMRREVLSTCVTSASTWKNAPERGFQSDEILLSGIVDRIGAGDSFAAGILHGLIEGLGLEDVARTGLALAVLKHSLPGDASLFTRRDLAAFREGGLDVRR